MKSIKMVRKKSTSSQKNLHNSKEIQESNIKNKSINLSATMNTSKRKRRPAKKICEMKDSGSRPFVMSAKIYKEIRRLQLQTKNVIPVAPFMRLLREILCSFGGPEMRIQRVALEAIQEACELYMTQFFEDSYLATLHAMRVTLKVKDMRFVRRIRGMDDIINH